MEAPRGAKVKIILRNSNNGRFLVENILKGSEKTKTVEIGGKTYKIKQLGV